MARWQLEGTAAEEYERYLVPTLFAPFADRLIELAQPRPGDRALDVACGTGIVARRVAVRVRRVVGLDVNPGMVEVARAAGPSIEWLAADAVTMPVPDESFDLVLCQQGVQHLPDRAAGLREMRRVLAPGGRSPSASGERPSTTRVWLRLAEALDRHAGPEIGAIMRAPFAVGAQELRDLITDFRDVTVRIRIAAVRFPSASELLFRQESRRRSQDRCRR
jgi:ubiquinone/menaquinone biosynthesis C-methylase UbiE